MYFGRKKHEILNNIAYICIFVIYPEALLSAGDQCNENSRSQKNTNTQHLRLSSCIKAFPLYIKFLILKS
jgi:hypothetical protein